MGYSTFDQISDGFEGTGYMVLSLGYRVHCFESTGHIVSGLPGYRVRGFSLPLYIAVIKVKTCWSLLSCSCTNNQSIKSLDTDASSYSESLSAHYYSLYVYSRD